MSEKERGRERVGLGERVVEEWRLRGGVEGGCGRLRNWGGRQKEEAGEMSER